MSTAPALAETVAAPAPRRRGRLLLPILLFGLLALAPLAVSLGMPSGWLALLTRAMIFAIAALSLDLILGVGGLVSFGHAAFLGIGAYVTGIMITEGQAEALLILPVVLGICALFAAITGAICLRTRGVTFIMITLAFGQMVYFLAQALSAYGGDDGLTLYEKSTIAGLDLFSTRTGFFYCVLAALAGCYVLVRILVASRFGRILRAARENPVRVSVTGFDVTRIRLVAYVISGMVAGIAGFFLANHTDFVSPAFMSWQRSVKAFTAAVLGGVGSLPGAMLGGLLIGLIESFWAAYLSPEYKDVATFAILILVLMFRPSGLLGRPEVEKV